MLDVARYRQYGGKLHLYVKVGELNHLESIQMWLVTVNHAGTVRLTVQHDRTVRVSFMYYPGNILGQTPADVVFLEAGHIYI
jgi:hypothetical protein